MLRSKRKKKKYTIWKMFEQKLEQGSKGTFKKCGGEGAINENVLSIMWAHPGNVCDELENFHPLVHLSGGSLRPPVSRDSKFSLRSRHLRITNKFS